MKDFWSSRPRRARRGRKCAGVAAGIGNRYGIDPVIVRVGFIVATVLGGFGVPLYLLGWLLLPDERDQVSPLESLVGRGRSSTPPHVTILLCILLIPSTGWFLGEWWFQGSGIGLLALLVIGLFVLHRARGAENRPTGSPAAAATAAPASFSAQQSSLDAETATESNYQPPSGVWDPLGADPMQWELPGQDPTAPEPPSSSTPGPRRRSSGGAITLGATLITAGVGTTLALVDIPWFTAPHVIGMTLAVLGIGMVLNAIVNGTGRGMLALAVPLAAAGVLVSMLPAAGFPSGGFDEVDAQPKKASEVAGMYQRTGGSITLDLTALPESPPIDTTVRIGMGEAKVIVPEDADVTFTCESSMGSVDCLGKTDDGLDKTFTDTSSGTGDQKINLNVSSVMGSVEVLRG